MLLEVSVSKHPSKLIEVVLDRQDTALLLAAVRWTS